MREKYGFSDENAEERAHQKALQQFLKYGKLEKSHMHMQCLSFLIIFMIEIPVLNGQDHNPIPCPGQQSVKQLAQKFSSTSEPLIVDIYSSHLLEFDDNNIEDTASTILQTETALSSSTSSSLIVNPIINSLWEPWLTSIDKVALQPALSIYETLILRPWAGISTYRRYGNGSLPVFIVSGRAKEKLRDTDYLKQLALQVSFNI